MTLSFAVCKHLPRTLAIFALVFAALLLKPAHAQTTNASLGGIVSDSTGARLPGVSVKLINESSRDTRQTKTNREGVFQFSAVPTGTYTVRAQETGFTTLNEAGIELHPNDVRTLPEIKLQVGEVTTDVDVDAVGDVPTSGEKSTLITAHDIQRLATVGRDVGELLKTQAGFSQVQSGLDNGGGTDPSVVSAGGSGLGNYVGNGSTGNGATVTSDGANVTDPVSGSAQTQTVNMDMVSEVKIETSNFGADVAKGPTVITAVGKSGGSTYHGSAYIYGRTADLNAEDWYLKFERLPPIPDHYIYPGFNVGGPFAVPGTKINRNKRLTFWVGGEDYIQRDVYAYGSPLKSYIQALVPTDQSTNPGREPGMRQGSFSFAEIGNFLGLPVDGVNGIQAQCTAQGTLVAYLHVCGQPGGNNAPSNGQIINIDPGAYALINSEMPLPTGPTVNGFNWSALNLTNQDLYQLRTKWDYALNDNNKFYVVFNTQQGDTSHIPEQTNYSPASGGLIMGGLDTPGKIHSTTSSNTASANYSHTFGARATNEVFAAIAMINTQFNSNNPSRLTKNAIGYPYHGIYSRGSCPGCGSDDFPQLGTYSSTNRYGLPLAITPDYSNGPYITKSFVPSAGDNFSLLIKSHTIKLGIYAERDSANSTIAGPLTNGQISQYYVGTQNFNDGACPGTTTCHTPDPGGSFPQAAQNYLADFFMGYINAFTQQNFNPKVDMYYWNVGWFVTDSWKATKTLTFDLGLRFDHLGGWTDNHGVGLATFSPTLYATDPAETSDKCGFLQLPGVRWHGGNPACGNYNVSSSTPLSGTPTRFAFISPRFGVAWDVFGTGKSVLRGGFGLFRAHDSYNDYQYTVGTAEGVITQVASGTGNGISLPGVDATAPEYACNAYTTAGCPSVSALDPTDNEQPLTYTYSFTVTQQMPKNFLFEIGYVGNQSHDLLMDAGAPNTMGNLQNINAIPLGGLFQPDPNINSQAGTPTTLTGPGPSEYGVVFAADAQSTAVMDDYRKYTHYTILDVPRHAVYANYNALQTSLNKQKGAFNMNVNYTWSRANGVRGGYNNGATQNPTDLRANYGPLGFDRTNIFAASYSYDEGQKIHSNKKWVNGVANGWFISGISTYQSGPNLQAVYSPSLAMGGNTTTEANGVPCNGSCNLDDRTVLGSPDIYLSPTLISTAGCPTANPTAGLKKHQYINAFCFGIPTAGENGSSNLGYLHGPPFYSNDLSVQRTVKLADRKNLQFRVSAFNFLNHPITTFNSHQTNEASLLMGGSSFATARAINTTNTNAVAGGDPSCSAAGSSCFGYAGYKTGRRVMEMSARYNF